MRPSQNLIRLGRSGALADGCMCVLPGERGALCVGGTLSASAAAAAKRAASTRSRSSAGRSSCEAHAMRLSYLSQDRQHGNKAVTRDMRSASQRCAAADSQQHVAVLQLSNAMLVGFPKVRPAPICLKIYADASDRQLNLTNRPSTNSGLLSVRYVNRAVCAPPRRSAASCGRCRRSCRCWGRAAAPTPVSATGSRLKPGSPKGIGFCIVHHAQLLLHSFCCLLSKFCAIQLVQRYTHTDLCKLQRRAGGRRPQLAVVPGVLLRCLLAAGALHPEAQLPTLLYKRLHV